MSNIKLNTKTHFMRKILFIILVFCAGFSMRAQTTLTTAVDFTVTTVEGTSFNLFNKLAENKYVCIDFFYYNCGPCQQTAPKVNGAYEYFGCNTSNVHFIGIDNGDDTQTTINFGNNFGAHYPAASGSDGDANAVVAAYGITAFPTVILIAPDHSIVEQDIWPIADAAYLYNLIQGHGGVAKTCSAGIEESKTSIPMLIMPNPANESTRILFTGKLQAQYDIKVYDVFGKQVFSNTITAENSNVSADINTSDFPTGNYFVKVFEDGLPVSIEKLSVIR